MIDLDWIQRLIRIVDESDVDTLEVSRFATKVRVSKSPPRAAGGGTPPAQAPRAASGPPADGTPAGKGDAPAEAEPAADAEGAPAGTGAGETGSGAEVASDLHEVTSPMVGTFYRAPAPDAPAYVEVGDRVEEGQTLCILEAMKLMNELDSDVSGVVEEICVENAEPVEYGDVLFRVDTGAG